MYGARYTGVVDSVVSGWVAHSWATLLPGPQLIVDWNWYREIRLWLASWNQAARSAGPRPGSPPMSAIPSDIANAG